MTAPSNRSLAEPAAWRVLLVFHALFMIARSSTRRLRKFPLAFIFLFVFLPPWLTPVAHAMSLEDLRAAQSRELDGLREEFRQKALAAQGNREQLDRLNQQYGERVDATRQKYLGTDTRGKQIQEIEDRYKGEIKNSGSAPKDVRADVDLAAKSHQAARDLADKWGSSGDVVQELPDGMGYVNKTRDITLWNPCETAACMEAKIKYHDAFGTEGGRAGTKVPGAVEDPRGWFLDNQKKLTHAVGEGDLKTAAKSVDKAAEAAGIKDANDPFWKQSERLRNYGDPVQAGIADLTDTPEQQQAKIKEWLRQATNRLDTAGEKLLQRTKFDDPDAKSRVEKGNVKADVENIRSRGGMETRGPSEERIRKGLSAGEVPDAPSKGAVVKGVAGGVVTGIVVGAAVSYVICMEEVGDHAVCIEAAKEAMSGEAIAQEVFWGAVAASGPAGVGLAAAYGAYHGAKQIVRLGEEGVAGVKDLLAREQERRAREAQQQKNLKNMEATISSLERELGGELDGLIQNRMAVHRLACEKADEAKRITEGLASSIKGLEGHDAELANASLLCKDGEQLMAEVKTRADNARRYAGLAEMGFEWIRKQIHACVSSGDVIKAVESVGSARGLAKGAAQNYSQAQDALAKLRGIRSESERMRGALSKVEGLRGAAHAKLLEADSAAIHANAHGFMADDLDQQIKRRKVAMLDRVRNIRGSFADDAREVDERFKPLVNRLTAEEPLNTKLCVDSAWAQGRLAQEMWKQVKARVDGLKSIPLCDTIAIPEGLVDDAARAMASMGLGGLGEGLEEQGRACLARLKPSDRPVAGTGEKGSDKDDKGGSGKGVGGAGGPGGEPPKVPAGILSRFGVSCRPDRIKVGQTASCRATGEYLDQPGVVVDLTGMATWSPGPTIRGDEPGSYFASATHAGASGSATVTVSEDEQKRPPDDGRKRPPGTDDGRKKSPGIDVRGKRPPDIKGATEAGEEFGGGIPPRGPTSGAAGGGQPVEQPGVQPPPGEQPPTVGAGGPAGPGAGQGVWCYFEKTPGMMVQYWLPEGPCPPVGHPPPDPRVPWQGLVPPGVGGAGGAGHGGGGGPKPPSGGGKGGGKSTSPPVCPPGCHIKPGTNKCHCGGG